MTYQVLARKWRPQTFKDMVGQDHISSTLCNAIKNQRVGHAYLFVGTRGTGKTTTARIFAKAINCENPLPDSNPCDQCTNCKEITAGSCMDVLEIDGASNNGVDDIRRLRDNVQYTPARCNYKVYIIDEVHMLSTAAWNALLKTLEEPPEHVKFLFATTEVHKVLPTILSRCQRFDLKRISQGTISRRLQDIAQVEQANFDQTALNAIARAANGGMRDALSIMDQMIAFCNSQESISEHDVSEVFGLTSNNDLAKITIAMLNDNAADVIKELNHLADVGRNLEQLYSDLLHFSRNLMICAISGEQAKDILDLDDHEISLTREIVSQTNTDTLQRMVDGYLAHDGQLRNTLNKRVFLEMTLVRIMKDAHAASLNDILKRLNTFRKTGSLAALEVEVPAQTISVQLPEIEKKTPVQTVEQKLTPETTPAPEPQTSEKAPVAPETIISAEALDTQKEPKEDFTTVENDSQSLTPDENKTEPVQETQEEKPDYLIQVPQSVQAPVKGLEASQTTQEKAPEQQKLSNNEDKQDEAIVSDNIPQTENIEKEPETTPEVNKPIANSVEKITIDDTISLSYTTLLYTDYTSKARLKDPGQFGLQRYQADFDENEETPGSALGVFYYRETNSNTSTEVQNTYHLEPQEKNIPTQNSIQGNTPSSVNSALENIEDEIVNKEQAPKQKEQEQQVISQQYAINPDIQEPIITPVQEAPIQEVQQQVIPQQYITAPEQAPVQETPVIPKYQPETEQEEIITEPTVAREDTSPVEKPEQTAARIWAGCQAYFNQQAPTLIPILTSLTPVSFTENTFILTTETQIQISEKLIAPIKSMISSIEPISGFDVKIITASPQTEDNGRTLSSNEEVWGRVNNNPLFSQLCQEFDGTIIDVRG